MIPINPKNIGGAMTVTGTSLIACGVLPQLGGAQSSALWYLALAGFILSAAGKGVTVLFTADATSVKNVSVEVDRINQLGFDPSSPQLVPQITPKPNPPVSP